MTLNEYLAAENLTETVFALKAGISQAHVNRLRKGKAWPQKQLLERILVVTGGKVTPNDFLSDAGAAA